jgi:hypothetical protein
MVLTKLNGLNLQASLPNSFFACQTPQILIDPFHTSKLVRCVSKETLKAECADSLFGHAMTSYKTGKQEVCKYEVSIKPGM